MGIQPPSKSRSSRSASASQIPSMPASIAPAALAQHLDDGWGDEDDGIASPAEASASGVTEAPIAPVSSPPPLDEESDWDLPVDSPIGSRASNIPDVNPASIDLQATQPPQHSQSAEVNRPAMQGPTLTGLIAPAIDITIEPTFSQAALDQDPPPKYTGAVTKSRLGTSDLQPVSSHADQLRSISPVTTAAANTSKRSRLWVLMAAGALIVGVTWGIAGAHRFSKVQAHRDASVRVVNGSPVVPAESAPQLEPRSHAVDAPPPIGTAVALGSSEAPISPTKAIPSSTGAGIAAKVRVEIEPWDSKVALNGRAAKAPYVFDVTKGSRVVLEIAHPGYITRRVVLDGSREFVQVAMIPEPKTEAPEPAPAPTPEVPTEL